MFYVLTAIVVGAVACVLVTRGAMLTASLAAAPAPVRRSPRLDALCEWALCGSLALLIVTGLFIAGGLTGFFLLLHVFGGAVFAVTLAAIAVLRAESNSGPCCTETCSIGLCVERMFFWALTATGLCMILTAVIAMTPLLGTAGQICIAAVHGYVSILASASGVGFTYFAVQRCRAAKTAKTVLAAGAGQ